jgi:hypothetical protein
MVDNPAWEICERVAEVQALLHTGTRIDPAHFSYKRFRPCPMHLAMSDIP